MMRRNERLWKRNIEENSLDKKHFLGNAKNILINYDKFLYVLFVLYFFIKQKRRQYYGN